MENAADAEPPDVREVFPPLRPRVTRPRQVEAEVRRDGVWVRARVLAWYLAETPPMARIEWPHPATGEMVPAVVAFAPGAIRPRHGEADLDDRRSGDRPVDRW
ncbi:hypothetical protein ACFVH6_37350 [Spirillospora sp. NPDC127200]